MQTSLWSNGLTLAPRLKKIKKIEIFLPLAYKRIDHAQRFCGLVSYI